MTVPVIELRDVWAGYGHEPILTGVSLTLAERDFVGMVGPNGGGKTTLLKLLLGLLEPIRGEVRVMGERPAAGRRHVGYVPQVVTFDPDFPITVREIVLMGRLGRRSLFAGYNRVDRDSAGEAMRSMGIEHLADRAIGGLSGGERQRTFIARALASEPTILLLDEPTASVDSKVQAGVYELLRKLNERITILLVTHDIGVISSYVKTIGCLNRTLHYHGTRELTADMLEKAYHCPVELIAHGVPHRVFPAHQGDGE